MAALTADRNTKARVGDFRESPLAAAVKVYAGAILMRNAAGYLTKGATATGAVGVGRAEAAADNSAGAAGALKVTWRAGIFFYGNSAAGDLIALADIGKICFIVDDQTVAKTDGGGTRSRAGIVEDVEGSGVWVRFDEAVTRGA
jgi:hypothetical protein